MRSLPTLRQELIVSLAVVFAGALAVAVLGILIMLPRLETAVAAALYVTLLVVADILVFTWFGRSLVRRRLLEPLDRLVEGVEVIAGGDYAYRLPPAETEELSRLSESVNEMTERLSAHGQALADNVRSLEATNRELTNARDELVRAEKMASVGRLASGIAHEVGNPLAAILGYVGLLGRGGDASRQELAEAAEREVRRIDRIVRGLLDYARPRDAKTQAIVVNDVVASSLELLEAQGRFANVEVKSDLAANLPAVVADPHKLQQVLVNLLLNATDAMEHSDGPTIRIRTAAAVHRSRTPQPARRRDDPPDVDYSHRRRFHRPSRIPREDPFPDGARIVEIEVGDNGPGVPPELGEQVFEPFVTTKETGKGTGLGLAVAAGLVDSMSGTIRLAESPGGGATFTVVLPAAGTAVGQVRGTLDAGATFADRRRAPAATRPGEAGGGGEDELIDEREPDRSWGVPAGGSNGPLDTGK